MSATEPTHYIVGHCPHCGAPIYVSAADHCLPPQNIFTCSCRLTHTIPQPVYVPVQSPTPNTPDWTWRPYEGPRWIVTAPPNSYGEATHVSQTTTMGDRKEYRVVSMPQFSIYPDNHVPSR